MPITVTAFEDTPNPNAIKCILDATVHQGSTSFRSPAAAADHPLAHAIFQVRGVTNLLLCDNWLTVCREPGIPWAPIKRGVRDALGRHT